MASWWVLGLALAGAALATYFTLAYYGWIDARALPPALCRRDERSCVTILQTPYARLFGVPNSLLGLLLYLLVLAVAALALAGTQQTALWWAALTGTAAAVALAPYLIWALVARLHTWCRL